MFVIVVEFEIVRETAAAFMALIRENAEASLRDEPGCRQFDVCVDETDPASVFLYEVYDDEAAFEACRKPALRPLRRRERRARHRQARAQARPPRAGLTEEKPCRRPFPAPASAAPASPSRPSHSAR